MELVLEYALEEIEQISQEVIKSVDGHSILLFFGEMGVGKTTLIKGICTRLGVHSVPSSPTYSIVNEYHSSSLGTLYHFDLYRIKNEREAEEIGFTEYLDSGHLCFVEWPENASSLLFSYKSAKLHMSSIDLNTRKILITT